MRIHVQEGQLVMAKVQRCSGAGLSVSLADGSRGRVQLTDLHDKFVANALQGLKPEQVVRARVTQTTVTDSAQADEANAQSDGSGGKGRGRRKGSEGQKREFCIRSLTLRPSAGCKHAGAIVRCTFSSYFMCAETD